ncbi:MAG: phytanoyl-CoA dioxygenase family protein [Planctomycetes bacterium]|nr:phytanoyl-CoA dioxygenase family protein [Planctomycetota bacterium]
MTALEMTDEQRFLFDLQGYLVIEGALPPEQVERMRATMDAHGISKPSNDPGRSRFSGFLDWGPEWRALLDHPRTLPVLRGVIGEKFRLDHVYGMAMRADGERGGEGLHHEAAMFDYGCFHVSHGARMHNGLVVVSFALNDVPAGAGGFCCIPGTHKSIYPPPPQVYDVDHPLVRHVPVRAGDVLVFSEALTHGTMPWTETRWERRAILLKYCPAYMQWGHIQMTVADSSAFTAQQLRILAPACAWQRKPVVEG